MITNDKRRDTGASPWRFSLARVGFDKTSAST
jgi:hypothetical protein